MATRQQRRTGDDAHGVIGNGDGDGGDGYDVRREAPRAARNERVSKRRRREYRVANKKEGEDQEIRDVRSRTRSTFSNESVRISQKCWGLSTNAENKGGGKFNQVDSVSADDSS